VDEMTRAFGDVCGKTGMINKGVFDCQGYLADEMHRPVQEMRKLDDAAWAERVAEMKGHPNDGDLDRAVTFARLVLDQ
jgi:hypothetical protein